MSTAEIEPVDGAGKIDPSLFPVPSTLTSTLQARAAKLRTGGQNMQETGDEIVLAWGGLTNCYTAPEAETLYAALDPLTSHGAVTAMATNRVAGALEDFAETVRGIQGSWRELKSEAYAFRAEIAEEGEDWDKGEGWFGFGDSSNVDKNDALLLRAANLVEDFKEAEVACANKINIGIDGRTDFLSEDDLGGEMPDANQFVHGAGVELEEIPTSWGEAAASTDHGWARDVGDAIWDFGVGAVEGTGAMLGAHSSEGWLKQSWGDSLKEYHWDNLTSAASLVGMYDAESDSLGWSGLDSAGEAWKDLAHSVVPWEEWGDRPGYVIGTALLNIGSVAVGAALTATGVGAVVGVPLMAWRGAAILDGMGGSGRGGSGVDVPNLPDMPTYGGSGAPVVNVDASNLSPTQMADMKSSLDRLPTNQSSSNESSPGGRPSQPRQPTDPTGADLAKAEKAASPEASKREGDAGDGSKKSDAKKAPNWTSDSKDSVEPNPKKPGSEKEPAYVGGRGDNDTLTESKKTPTSTPAQPNANKIDAPGTGTRSGNEIPDQQTGNRDADLRDNKSNVQNQSDKGPVPPKDDSGRYASRSEEADSNSTRRSSDDPDPVTQNSDRDRGDHGDREKQNGDKKEKSGSWKDKNKEDMTLEELEKRRTFLENVNGGIEFNHEREPYYKDKGGVNELYVGEMTEKGSYHRVDSYIPNKEIVSRKFTQLSEVLETSALKSLNEAVDKYSPGTLVTDVPSGHEKLGSDGVRKPLVGKLYLEVPPQKNPVPKAVLEAAEDLDVRIRDTEGKVYSLEHPNGKLVKDKDLKKTSEDGDADEQK